MGLALPIVVLLTPVDAYEGDKMLSDNEWSYEQYFKNEHGFYSDDITKRQAYFVQLPQLIFEMENHKKFQTRSGF